MKNIWIALLILSTGIQAQEIDKLQIKEALIAVSNRICTETTFNFINRETGEIFDKLNSAEPNVNIQVESYFNDWSYENGVTFMGLQELSDILGDPKYADYVNRNFDWVFNGGHLAYFENLYQLVLNKSITVENKGEFAAADGLVGRVSYHQLFRLNRLDDCGSLGCALINNYKYFNHETYKTYIEKAANYILKDENRLESRAFCRSWPEDQTVWADDLYMGIPFMAKYAELTQNAGIYDDAVNQVIEYNTMLWSNKKELYFHCYFNQSGSNGVAHWGRANGWVIVAQVMLLEVLPEDHPQREKLIQILTDQVQGLARYQNAFGLWHQLLDKPDSYPETSCTAMFVYGIAKAVNEGWIDKDFMQVAEFGWQGLMSMMTKDYDLSSVCIGTGVRPSLSYYYNRPTTVNGHHALGAFILAGCELYRAEKFELPSWN